MSADRQRKLVYSTEDTVWHGLAVPDDPTVPDIEALSSLPPNTTRWPTAAWLEANGSSSLDDTRRLWDRTRRAAVKEYRRRLELIRDAVVATSWWGDMLGQSSARNFQVRVGQKATSFAGFLPSGIGLSMGKHVHSSSALIVAHELAHLAADWGVDGFSSPRRAGGGHGPRFCDYQVETTRLLAGDAIAARLEDAYLAAGIAFGLPGTVPVPAPPEHERGIWFEIRKGWSK